MRILFFISTIIITNIVTAQIISVKQDGTGDYTTIQEGINASSNGDTVLVWPGTYYENINLNGKNITLASLNLTTGDTSYIHNTIIDGNHISNCVKVLSGETNVVLSGFTIQHGGGYVPGGGIHARDVFDLTIQNCIIKNNRINGSGAGIACSNTSVYLSGVNIYNNHGYSTGGAIALASGSTIQFDSINLCNIHLNYAALGCDIHKSSAVGPIHIIVDTFTVMNPDNYYLSSIDMYGFQVGGISWEIQNQKITPVNGDLFVNPSGSDTNSGISPDEPLRSASFALTRIISDSTHQNTIHLANGIYSASTTDEKFPLNLRSYVSFEGQNQDSTILDGDSLIYLLKGNNEINHFEFRNLTIRNGNGITNTSIGIGLMDLYVVDNVIFNNVSLTKGVGNLRSTFHVKAHRCKFINCKIFNNYGGKPHMGIGSRYTVPGVNVYDTCELINSSIFENKPAPNPQHGAGDGLFVSGVLSYPNALTCNIIGCEFIENQENFSGQFAINALFVGQRSNVNLINSTIGNNVCLNSLVGYSIGISSMAQLNIYNSVVFGNINKQICVVSYPDEPCTLNVYNSLVEGGFEDIFIDELIHTIHYDLTNIDTDPMWDTAGMYPYSLMAGSPCIDAGTLDLPDGIVLPDTDLAGNPRIYGGSIDMGAYEWFPVGITEQDSKRQTAKEKLLKVSPNPFSYSTYISYEVPDDGHVVIEVYDMQGRKQTTLMDTRQLPGSGEFYWAGNDDYNYPLRSGTYIIRLIIDDRVQETVKVVKK